MVETTTQPVTTSQITTSQTPVAGAARRHDIDALRVFAFGILILYHVGMFYVADWHWHVKSAYLSESLQWLMLLVNPWRMALIFLISGVAVHFLLRKVPASLFALMRTRRLLVPLFFGMVVVVPPQAYVQALSTGAFDDNYLQFLWRYFTFQPWPTWAFDGAQPVGVTWNHLWYLPYVLTYSLLLAALLPVLRSLYFQMFVNAFHRLRGWQVLLLPALPFLFYEWWLSDRFPTTHAFYDDWYYHAVSCTVFFLGFVLGSRDGLWRELQRLRWLALGLAIVSYVCLMLVAPYLELRLSALAHKVVSVFNGWFWLVAVLGWAHHTLNRPFRWLAYATEAIFPWYILHQTFTVLAGYYLSRWALGPVVEPLVVTLLTIGGCLVVHEYGVRRWRYWRPLFGMR